jgi:protein-tyrosine phosphatase
MDSTTHDLLDTARLAGVPSTDLPVHFDHTRIIEIEGTLNVRDIGGIHLPDGRTVNRGILYRSDQLSEVTDAGLELMTELRIAHLFDFRLQSERERQPSRLPNGARIELLSIGDLGPIEAMIEKIPAMLTGRIPMEPATWWDDNYLDMVERAQGMFAALVRSLTEPSLYLQLESRNASAMYHCTGGKDRTGLATALMLQVVGVDEAAIVDDFLSTNIQRTTRRLPNWLPTLAEAGIAVGDALPIIGVTRSAITAALRDVDRRGGAAEYFINAGVSPAELQRLTDLLVATSS